MNPPRAAVVVRLSELQAPSARTVVAAALQLFGPGDPVDVVLVLPGVAEATEEHGLPVVDLVHSFGLGGLPEVLLQGEGEASALTPLVDVVASGDPVADARAVVLLGAAAQQVWDPEPEPAVDLDALREARGAVERVVAERDAVLLEAKRALVGRERARGLERLARRDVRAALALRAGARRPLVALLFQHRSYWGAVATLHAALLRRSEVDVVVVALDSAADGRGASTAAFLAEQGVTSRSAGWLLERLDDVDLLVLADPYDELRPPALRVPALVARGVRLAAVPYGGNAIAGPLMDVLLWDLPLQRAAWRAYVASPTQHELWARHCAAGAEPVRVLGVPKADRVVQAARGELDVPQADAWRARAAGRPVVLWNPHFRVGEGGWSTFAQYLEPVMERFAADDRALLLVRPHFRLFPDLRVLGLAHLEAQLRAFVARTPHVVLDESPDHLAALTACDAMLSDLSSLATELLPTGKPVLYLHRADGPGPNEEGAHFADTYRADGWDDVTAFLDLVVAGEDPQGPQRRAAVAAGMPLADGEAGRRVADDLVDGLLADLQVERAVPAPRAAPVLPAADRAVPTLRA